MNVQRTWQIAKWEYLQKVRTKSFIIGLFLTPLIMVLFGVVPTLLINKSPGSTVAVGIIDSSGRFYGPLKERLEKSDTLAGGQPMYVLQNFTRRDIQGSVERADSQALQERIEGVIVVRDSLYRDSATGLAALRPVASYRSPNPTNFRITRTFEDAIGDISLEQQLKQAGIDSAKYHRLSRNIPFDAVKLSSRGAKSGQGFGAIFISAYIGIFLLMFLTLTAGQTLVRSLVEEKSNRIMEMLTSSSTPQELMWGKLLGMSGLGATQILTWLLFGLLAVLYFSSGFPSGIGEILRVMPLTLLYILLGYLFYAAIFIGVGSLATTEQEAQMTTQYLSLFLTMPLAFAFIVIQDPSAGYVRVLSFIPVFTPSLMMIRLVTKTPPAWEIAATVALMLASTAAVAWAAGKVFRTAILLYGKRPAVREVLRWFREA